MRLIEQRALSVKIATSLVQPALNAISAVEAGGITYHHERDMLLFMELVDLVKRKGVKMPGCPVEIKGLVDELANAAVNGAVYEYDDIVVKKFKSWIGMVKNQMTHARHDVLLSVIDDLTILTALRR